MKTYLRSFGVTSLVLVALAQASSQELMGADAALQKAAAARATDPKDRGKTGLKKAVDAYVSASKSMSPSAAAAGWLALCDRTKASPEDGPVPFTTVVSVLPSPSSWNEIAAGLRKRTPGKDLHSASVRLFAELLGGNAQSEWTAMAAVMAHQNETRQGGMGDGIVDVYRELAKQTGDRKRLALAVVMDASQKGQGDGIVQVPDLVTLVGPQEAEQILTQALVLSSKTLQVNEGKATRALAQRLALANASRLKTPHWSLVDVKTTKLYEAMAKRFPKDPPQGIRSFERIQAKSRYLFGLFLEGRRAEALKLARGLGSAGRYYGLNDKSVEDLVGSRDFTSFLSEVVAGNPESSFWDLYLVSAARSGNSNEVVARLQREAANPKLTAKSRAKLNERLGRALLAADHVDEALALMKRSFTDGDKSTALVSAVTYARIGHLLGRLAVVEEGIAAAKRLTQSTPSDRYSYYFDNSLGDLLLDLGRNAEAEKLAVDAYVKSVGGPEGRYAFAMQADPSLVNLARLYYRLDRPGDVRALLDRAPEWGAKDAIDLAQSFGIYENEETPLGFVVAWALAKTGEKAAAETVLNRVLASHGGFDPAYALLRELKGADAIPRLDALYAADQFEERPLIWKAVALKDLGRLPEAEATIRKAISVDPSDGETHGGHRMYAYTVLADVLAARGDETSAKEYRAAVAAIRLAEHADELAQVGMLSRAIAQYEESTRLFSDAYCIQSRLAVDLMEQGRAKEAEEHYRRAYELMPSSFGRVETHCMGCEHVFEGEIAQNIAERVFGQLVVKTPEKPQVHYLLGYLRYEQGRYPEAMASYRKAVALDPEYLNAWKQMAALSDLMPVSLAERNAITSAILRLDPLQKHGTQEPIGDLRETWRRVDHVLTSLQVEGPTTAYRLAASADAREKRQSTGEEFPDMSDLNPRLSQVVTPGAAVAMHPLVRAVLNLIEQGGMGVSEEG